MGLLFIQHYCSISFDNCKSTHWQALLGSKMSEKLPKIKANKYSDLFQYAETLPLEFSEKLLNSQNVS